MSVATRAPLPPEFKDRWHASTHSGPRVSISLNTIEILTLSCAAIGAAATQKSNHRTQLILTSSARHCASFRRLPAGHARHRTTMRGHGIAEV
jgi:hypothetical protein